MHIRKACVHWAALGLVLSILCATLAGCSDTAPQSVAKAADQTLNYQLAIGANDIATFDPAQSVDYFSYEAIYLVFPGLVASDGNLNVIPWAAERMPDISSDGMTYTFHIRAGLHWSDGTPIDASTFAYSLNRSLSPCLGSSLAYYFYPIQDAQSYSNATCSLDGKTVIGSIWTLIGRSLIVSDPHTLVIKLAKPASYFLQALTYPTAYAQPKQLIERWGDKKWTDHLVENGGFGGNLYKVVQWDHNGALSLTANAAFWGEKPAISTVNFHFYMDQDTGYKDFVDGKHDVSVSVPLAQYQGAKALDKSKGILRESPNLQTNYVAGTWTHPPFDDVRVRLAFSNAINRNILANKVLKGTAIPSYHIVPQGMLGYNSRLTGPDGTTSLDANAAKAKGLIQQYANDKYGGDIAKIPPITLSYPAGSQDNTNIAQALRQMWQTAMPGIRVNLSALDFDTLINRGRAHQLQLYMLVWIPDYPDPYDWLTLQFDPASDGDYAAVNDAQAFALMKKADSETGSQRYADYNQAEQLSLDHGAWMPYSQAKNIYVLRPWVQDFALDPLGIPALPTWQRAFIAQH
ncbi:MAG: peptide ABC transporter substrate-binding protein [Ktedonobacterales bacterium]